jgi:heme-degrading monooxygenase HmoA
MILSKFIRTVLLASVFFLISCNGEEKKTETETTSDTVVTAATPEPPPVTSTIVTTPSNMMIAKHKVKDFDAWKASYDAHDSMRLANGLHSFVVARGAADPNMVLVAVKVDDMEKAKAFAKNPSLKQAMQKGGVVGSPAFSFITMVYQDTGKINYTLRSETSFTVKDWNTWKTAFESFNQERMNAGIMLRAYGHEADNDKNVRVVVAISDSAKAVAYWNSDELKKRMEEGGVIGKPKRFLFHVAQRY